QDSCGLRLPPKPSGVPKANAAGIGWPWSKLSLAMCMAVTVMGMSSWSGFGIAEAACDRRQLGKGTGKLVGIAAPVAGGEARGAEQAGRRRRQAAAQGAADQG